MINIWDDHEIAGNHWRTGAQSHDSLTEGSWEERRSNAKKAFLEWIPTRVDFQNPIYRSFHLGKIATLHMLDTRSCCRTGIASSDEESERMDMIGLQQFEWLKNEIDKSNATWHIVGNQVAFVPRDYHTWYPSWKSYDNWTGYPNDYGKVVDLFRESNKNFLIATGDTHSSFYSLLIDSTSSNLDTLAREFIVTSVTSTTWEEGFEQSRPGDTAFVNWVNQQFEEHNPHIPWFDLKNHGFLILTLERSKVTAQWFIVDNILSKDFNVSLINEVTVVN
jgi:alkaline phosphatase D